MMNASEAPRLYERAAAHDASELTPLWHLDASQTFFVGPLDYNASHQHGAPVFLAGPYGSFGLRIRAGRWRSCRTAMIPAGVPHELDLGGNPLAVLYVEPHADGTAALAPLVGDADEVDGALVGRSNRVGLMRELFEDRTSSSWITPALADLVRFSAERRRTSIDPRLQRALAQMQVHARDLTPSNAAAYAQAAGLSASRFQHLFTADVGVPFRRYRAWLRMREAIAEIVSGANFTSAAHTAGFADQAHFAHDFRKTFGAPASRSLIGLRR